MILAAAYYGAKRISRAWLDGNLIDFRKRTYLTVMQDAPLSGFIEALTRAGRQSGASAAMQLVTAAAADADYTAPARVAGSLMAAAITAARPDDTSGGTTEGKLGHDKAAAVSDSAFGRNLRLVFGSDFVRGAASITAAGGEGLSPESADSTLEAHIVGKTLKSLSSSGTERNIENASVAGRPRFAIGGRDSSGSLFGHLPGRRSTLVRRIDTDSLGTGRGKGNPANTELGSSAGGSIGSNSFGSPKEPMPGRASGGLAGEEADALQAEPVRQEASAQSLSAVAWPTEAPPLVGESRGSLGSSAADAERKTPVQSGKAAAMLGGTAIGEAQSLWAVLRDGTLYIYQAYDAQQSGAYLTIE